MNILWSPQAIDDLSSLRAYIAQDHPSAALAVALHLTHSIEQLLPYNPQMGRPGRVPGTREHEPIGRERRVTRFELQVWQKKTVRVLWQVAAPLES